MSTPNKPLIDPKELVPAGMGLVLGLGILTLLICIGLALGLTPSLQFGIPNH